MMVSLSALSSTSSRLSAFYATLRAHCNSCSPRCARTYYLSLAVNWTIVVNHVNYLIAFHNYTSLDTNYKSQLSRSQRLYQIRYLTPASKLTAIKMYVSLISGRRHFYEQSLPNKKLSNILFSKIVSEMAARDWVFGGGAWRLAGAERRARRVRGTACNDVMAKDRWQKPSHYPLLWQSNSIYNAINKIIASNDKENLILHQMNIKCYFICKKTLRFVTFFNGNIYFYIRYYCDKHPRLV